MDLKLMKLIDKNLINYQSESENNNSKNFLEI